MITSSLIETPFLFVCHKVSGIPTANEFALAIEHALQHPELPVLWDLRELDFDTEMLAHEDNLRSLVSKWRLEMSSKKRAFVVNSDLHDIAEQFLGGLRLPVSWGVFESSEAAISWMQAG